MRLAWPKDSDATAPFQVRRIHVWSGRPQRAKSFRAESRAAQYGQKIDRVGHPAAAYLSSGNQSSDWQTARSEVVAKAFRARHQDRPGRGQLHGRPLDPRDDTRIAAPACTVAITDERVRAKLAIF